MKRFHVPLESAQKLRLRQLETEELKLTPLYRELETIAELGRQLQLDLTRETMRVADPALALRSFDLEIQTTDSTSFTARLRWDTSPSVQVSAIAKPSSPGATSSAYGYLLSCVLWLGGSPRRAR